MHASQLYMKGYKELVSVIPPEANLSPQSKIKPDSRGKAPGRRGPHGWAGYPWQGAPCTEADAERMDRDHANIGLAATSFPALDIDCTDEGLAAIVERLALKVLGQAPQRIGRFPKRLLMYRTTEPFGRMRLWIKHAGKQHLVEMLGQGQQYVIAGIHPATTEPYSWDQDLPEPIELTAIDKDMVEAFFTKLEAEIEFLDCQFEREGSGALATDGPSVEQASLRAPSMAALAEAVSSISNDAAGYEEYVTMGIAIKAAGQTDPVRALEIFQEWSARWENGVNDPNNVARDWARMRSPYRIGWDWVSTRARRYGYLDAKEEFEVSAEPPPAAAPVSGGPVEYSDRAMANKLIAQHGHEMKFCDALGGWLVWDGSRWSRDETMQVHDWAGKILAQASAEALGRVDFSATKADALAQRLASNAGRSAVVNYARADRRVSAAATDFDADPWVLNTPGGVVDLTTGQMRERVPGEALMSCTSTAPNFSRRPMRWLEFLSEATKGDRAMIEFLQVWSGYMLTGQTIEQKFAFLYGPGGNGKSVFVNTIAAVMGSYAGKAAMEAFTASQNDRHPTELARLRGLRAVYASETADGKRWNESRIKEITGGEPVTARFMHKDEFSYTPIFKLMFMGNTRPELRSIDEGIKRRLLLVPFTVTPTKPDPFLAEKLREEFDAILGWMIEGAIMWQSIGLVAPETVTAATTEYFEEEDALGRWIKERCYLNQSSTALTSDLYDDWREWCGEAGEFVVSQKKFSQAVRSRGFEKWRSPMTGRQGFKGIELLKDNSFGVVDKQHKPGWSGVENVTEYLDDLRGGAEENNT
jgi:P4 family phage/plasmid primase-like protien